MNSPLTDLWQPKWARRLMCLTLSTGIHRPQAAPWDSVAWWFNLHTPVWHCIILNWVTRNAHPAEDFPRLAANLLHRGVCQQLQNPRNVRVPYCAVQLYHRTRVLLPSIKANIEATKTTSTCVVVLVLWIASMFRVSSGEHSAKRNSSPFPKFTTNHCCCGAVEYKMLDQKLSCAFCVLKDSAFSVFGSCSCDSCAVDLRYGFDRVGEAMLRANDVGVVSVRPFVQGRRRRVTGER